jgi:hypothetical protein
MAASAWWQDARIADRAQVLLGWMARAGVPPNELESLHERYVNLISDVLRQTKVGDQMELLKLLPKYERAVTIRDNLINAGKREADPVVSFFRLYWTERVPRWLRGPPEAGWDVFDRLGRWIFFAWPMTKYAWQVESLFEILTNPGFVDFTDIIIRWPSLLWGQGFRDELQRPYADADESARFPPLSAEEADDVMDGLLYSVFADGAAVAIAQRRYIDLEKWARAWGFTPLSAPRWWLRIANQITARQAERAAAAIRRRAQSRRRPSGLFSAAELKQALTKSQEEYKRKCTKMEERCSEKVNLVGERWCQIPSRFWWGPRTGANHCYDLRELLQHLTRQAVSGKTLVNYPDTRVPLRPNELRGLVATAREAGLVVPEELDAYLLGLRIVERAARPVARGGPGMTAEAQRRVLGSAQRPLAAAETFVSQRRAEQLREEISAIAGL